MEVPPPSSNNQDSPAFILMQMKNSDERMAGPSSSSSSYPPPPPPSSHKLSHILSQSPPHQQAMHTQLPPSSSFNFNYMPPINSVAPPPMGPRLTIPSIPRLSLPVARPSSAPGSPNTPHSTSSSSPSTPISSPRSSGGSSSSGGESQRKQADCKLKHCLLCERGQPALLVKAPTWASIMRVVFYCLKYDMNEKHYFSLKTDVYSFMLAHWDKLCLNKKKSDNWHKQIQDMLSHSKNLFESGMDKYKQNGFWRLKTLTDPWTITKDRSPRKNSDPPQRDPSVPYGSSSDDDAEVDHDAPDRSPKRVKMELSQDESITPEDAERQRKLESEVSSLKLQLHTMTDTLVGLKEELKQREDSLQSQREAYEKLTEEFCVLQILAQREVNSNFKLASPLSASQVISNIIHANSSSASTPPFHPSSSSEIPNGAQGGHPFNFSQQELRKLEELKRAEEMRKIDEIRATMATTGSLPMHKLEELRGNFVFSNYILPPKVEELRNSPRTPRDGSPRDMSRDPSPRTDTLASSSPRELIMRDGSPRTELLRSSELPMQLPLRESQRERMKRDSRDSPRNSPRNSPRMSSLNPASPLARERSNSNPSSSHLIHASLNLSSPRDGHHHLNSPRDHLLLATSNLSLNSPREALTASGGVSNSNNSNNNSNSNNNNNNPPNGAFYFAPPANSPRDLLSINNILNNHPSASSSSSAPSTLSPLAALSESSSESSKFPPHIPQINLRNVHTLHHPSPPSSPVPTPNSSGSLNPPLNNLTLNDSSDSANTPNRLSPLHQVLPQYIPKPRSPTHPSHPSHHDHPPHTPPSPSNHLLQQMHQNQLLQMYQLQQQQLQQQQQQHLQQQQQHLQQHQLLQLHQQYQLQMQQLQLQQQQHQHQHQHQHQQHQEHERPQ